MRFAQKGGSELLVIIIIFIFAALLVQFNPLAMFQGMSTDQQADIAQNNTVKIAILYTTALINACPENPINFNQGIVTWANNACVKKLLSDTALPKANMFVHELLIGDPYADGDTGTLVLQCAGYAITLSDIFGKPLEHHDAWDYDTAGNKYKYYVYKKNDGSSKIKPGDFVVWHPDGTDGHIAFVESVNATGDTFVDLAASGDSGHVYKEYPDHTQGIKLFGVTILRPSGWLEPIGSQ